MLFTEYLSSSGARAICFLAGLLVVSAPRLAAQVLLADPTSSPTQNAREAQQTAQYRAQKVHSVCTFEQTVDLDEPSQPPTSRLSSYQERDAQGRLRHRYLASASGQLVSRFDLEYGPDGQATSVSVARRLADPADTTRLGRVWLPESFTSYPPAVGEGYAAIWDDRTGDWQRTNTFRRWISHDTTYLAIRMARLAG